ncbi:hypothetical protein A3I25_02590 [Candidatus Nomurabacteria bacterium RIFCSPLOWO2_02_FULL_42_17]|uniref:Phospho-N-acetylmuramoyl-pentapeptide-transferase n=1 Tax=Candidatus Nomurabacteria bacterium RIFCSPLOWO2_02_FULL_42_17 TaxID=1801789 RepID=A0A1F6XUI3_9BACT|nr:MAG: Phospho-N-acetylmuramoyl-pentapeptide-transferase [Parcubacteria group bacterium GW2011_GWA2_42_18]OGI97799.1 MAG: hypothetical protein A3I25_02590 [Candidatus Nomurabacteria bacterium RIFCSPLOWO2_02_FULL_42_17]
MIADITKILVPFAASFIIGIVLTPFITHYLYKYRLWKKQPGKKTLDGKDAMVFNSLHKEREVTVPRMGGTVIWLSVFITASAIWLISKIFPGMMIEKLEFLSRKQTWLPLFAFMFGAVIGLVDDFLETRGTNGLSLKRRLVLVTLVATFCAWWFWVRLGVSSISVPFLGTLDLDWMFMLFFVGLTLFIYAGGIIDGLDGLAGGVFAVIFSAYTVLAFFQNQIDLAAFTAAIVGGIMAFLWFNIPPARFYMSETGTMALTLALVMVAFLSDRRGMGAGMRVLPIIAFPLVVTVFSNIIQMISKKFRRGKKIFLITPLHHHFEALGWPAYKVTMRFWVLSVVFAVVGLIVAFIHS